MFFLPRRPSTNTRRQAICHFTYVVLEVLLVLVSVLRFAEADMLVGYSKYRHIRRNSSPDGRHVLRSCDGVLVRREKDPRLTLGSSYVSGYWEVRAIGIDGGSTEIEASCSIPGMVLCVMCPQ